MWKSGDFDRSLIGELFHPFCPAHAADSLQQVDLNKLWATGKRLIMLDIDNTLVQWKTEVFAPPVQQWCAEAKSMGFELCIISNTNNVERLGRLAKMIGAETVRGRFKPSRAMFRLALIKFKRQAKEAVMIGDQMMTDILGANRAGIDAIWVRKMEGSEFGPTKINRFVERLLQSAVYKALITPADVRPSSPAAEQAKPVQDRTLVKQLIRFSIVGGTSFVIDTGLTSILMKTVHVGGAPLSTTLGNWLIHSFHTFFSFANEPSEAAAPILGGIAAFVAMFNSFILNRAWTFQQRSKEDRLAQMRRFYVVSVAGALLSTVIFSTLYHFMPKQILLSKIGAAVIVAVWNFLGQRYYAFRARPVDKPG